MENLERRELMAADYLVLDWTPDQVPGQQNTPNSFVSTFLEVRDPYGRVPAFFDFNGNRYLDTNDVERAAEQIANRVGQIFGNSVQVYQGDLWQDSNWGQKFLAWGQNSPSLVDVIYVGGWDVYGVRPGSQPGQGRPFGVAFQPPTGTSYEYHGYTFTSEIASFYQQNKPYATPTDFANQVAQTIAHEAGHLLGLGHVVGHPQGDPNLMSYGADPNNSHFPNRWYNNITLFDSYQREYTGWQNPWQEVVASYQSQSHSTPTQLGKPLYNFHHLEDFATTAGSVSPHRHAGHEHEHDHEHTQDGAHDHGHGHTLDEQLVLHDESGSEAGHDDSSEVEMLPISTELMCMLSGMTGGVEELLDNGELTDDVLDSLLPATEDSAANLAIRGQLHEHHHDHDDDRLGSEIHTAPLAVHPESGRSDNVAPSASRTATSAAGLAARDRLFEQENEWQGFDEVAELLAPAA